MEVADENGTSITSVSLQHKFHRPLHIVPEMARGDRALVVKSRAVMVDHFFHRR